jgi:ubiquinone/menaquinone biosynthesis C-methylase UbiE
VTLPKQPSITYCLSLIPPLKDGGVIHDNACGPGVVNETIISRNPSAIYVEPTDIEPKFVRGVAALAKNINQWPVAVTTISAQELTSPDNTFTHSITSFAFHCLGDHGEAAQQVYRTLKPNGVAISTTLAFTSHVEALRQVH